MQERSPNFFLLVMEAIEQQASRARSQAINLGATAGPNGGTGTPPGGFVGSLRQSKVAYDTTEAAYLSGGSSLVDNLAHIRARLTTLEGGADTLAIEMAWIGY